MTSILNLNQLILALIHFQAFYFVNLTMQLRSTALGTSILPKIMCALGDQSLHSQAKRLLLIKAVTLLRQSILQSLISHKFKIYLILLNADITKTTALFVLCFEVMDQFQVNLESGLVSYFGKLILLKTAVSEVQFSTVQLSKTILLPV